MHTDTKVTQSSTQSRIVYGLVLTSMMILATDAHARRSDREGFNFGTSVRLMDADDRNSAGTEKSSRVQSQGNSFSPYVGYGFESLNIGLVANIESRKEVINEKNSITSQEILRDSETNTKAISVFGRFNFGNVMFMEAGFGLYSQVNDVHTEYRIPTGNGAFNATTDDNKLTGTGPGYHVGGGLELPIDEGFYFTASYLVRSFNLRDQTKSEFGDRIGTQQKRELNFGLAYYN